MTDFEASADGGPASPASLPGTDSPVTTNGPAATDSAAASDAPATADARARAGLGTAADPADEDTRGAGPGEAGLAEAGQGSPGRAQAARPKRAEVTRAALLNAAASVFAASGYSDANVDEIVEQAGTSVGTLYHHFGSKADLYVRLYLDYQSRQHHRSAKAFRAAVAAGEDRPMTLFLTGTRAYLEGAWNDRHIGKIFVSGGGPPGFDGLVRRRFRDWLDINAAGFDQEARPFSPTRLLVLTAIVTEAGREVTGLASRREAHAFIDEVLSLMGQLQPQPAPEPHE
jgi:AcrR family transcriptional regulator